MEKTRLLTIAVVALLILNAVTLTVLWFGHLHNRQTLPPLDRNGRTAPAAFLIKELGFDEHQKAVYDRLRVAHRTSKDSLQQILREEREAYFKGISTNDTSKIGVIGEIQKESDRITFVHFQEVRTLCRPDQQVKFDAVIGEVLKMMGRNNRMLPRGN